MHVIRCAMASHQGLGSSLGKVTLARPIQDPSMHLVNTISSVCSTVTPLCLKISLTLSIYILRTLSSPSFSPPIFSCGFIISYFHLCPTTILQNTNQLFYSFILHSIFLIHRYRFYSWPLSLLPSIKNWIIILIKLGKCHKGNISRKVSSWDVCCF